MNLIPITTHHRKFGVTSTLVPPHLSQSLLLIIKKTSDLLTSENAFSVVIMGLVGVMSLCLSDLDTGNFRAQETVLLSFEPCELSQWYENGCFHWKNCIFGDWRVPDLCMLTIKLLYLAKMLLKWAFITYFAMWGGWG